MLVKNLVSWSGEDFGYEFGAEIELPDNVALDRIAAGLCSAIEKPDVPVKQSKKKTEPVDQDTSIENG